MCDPCGKTTKKCGGVGLIVRRFCEQKPHESPDDDDATGIKLNLKVEATPAMPKFLFLSPQKTIPSLIKSHNCSHGKKDAVRGGKREKKRENFTNFQHEFGILSQDTDNTVKVKVERSKEGV